MEDGRGREIGVEEHPHPAAHGDPELNPFDRDAADVAHGGAGDGRDSGFAANWWPINQRRQERASRSGRRSVFTSSPSAAVSRPRSGAESSRKLAGPGDIGKKLPVAVVGKVAQNQATEGPGGKRANRPCALPNPPVAIVFPVGATARCAGPMESTSARASIRGWRRKPSRRRVSPMYPSIGTGRSCRRLCIAL